MNRLQLYLLLQNAVIELKTNKTMQLTRSAILNPVKMQFKKAVGLKKNANAQEMLNAIGEVYLNNQMGAEFVEKVTALKGEQWIEKDLLERIQMVAN